MPRRVALMDRQRDALLCLPVDQAELLRHYTPLVLVQFLAQQIGAPWPVFLDYARRDTTRREHFGEAAERLGLRVCTSADRRDLLVCATNEAMTTDKPRSCFT